MTDMIFLYSLTASLISGVIIALLLKSQQGQVPFKLFGISLIFGLAGTALLWISTNQIENSLNRADWLSVKGIIIGSKIIGERAPHPQVIYKYSVDNINYRDTTEPHIPGFSFFRIRNKVAMVTLADFPPGDTIPVFYDPGNPRINYITNLLNWSVYGQTGLAISLIAFMVTISLLYRKLARVS